jgi:hypothetical protein
MAVLPELGYCNISNYAGFRLSDMNFSLLHSSRWTRS